MTKRIEEKKMLLNCNLTPKCCQQFTQFKKGLFRPGHCTVTPRCSLKVIWLSIFLERPYKKILFKAAHSRFLEKKKNSVILSKNDIRRVIVIENASEIWLASKSCSVWGVRSKTMLLLTLLINFGLFWVM